MLTTGMIKRKKAIETRAENNMTEKSGNDGI